MTAIFDFVKQIQLLNITESEMAMLSALILISSGEYFCLLFDNISSLEFLIFPICTICALSRLLRLWFAR